MNTDNNHFFMNEIINSYAVVDSQAVNLQVALFADRIVVGINLGNKSKLIYYMTYEKDREILEQAKENIQKNVRFEPSSNRFLIKDREVSKPIKLK